MWIHRDGYDVMCELSVFYYHCCYYYCCCCYNIGFLVMVASVADAGVIVSVKVRAMMAVDIVAGVVVTGAESIYLVLLALVNCLNGTIVLIIT